MNIDVSYDTFDLRLDLRARRRCHHRAAVHAHGQRHHDQEYQRGNHTSDVSRPPALFHGHELALALQDRLEHRDKWDLFVHLGIAESDGGLIGKYLHDLEVCRREEIRVTALHAH